MQRTLKVAAVQMEPRLGEVEHNLSECLQKLALAAAQGARLIVFPECTLSGYAFSSLEQALPSAEAIPGPSVERIAHHTRELGVYAVIGLLETDEGRCYNASVLVGPDGLIGKHRKSHLASLGVDPFLSPGDTPLTVHDTGVGRIGMAICADCCFPEHIRVLALQGAEIIALPTNLPEVPTIRVIRDAMIPARAAENAVYLVAADRVGAEGDLEYLGGSEVIGPFGTVLANAQEHRESIVYADIDLAVTREKRGLLSRRRPELYGLLVQEMNDALPQDG